MKYREYKILSALTSGGLEKKVNEALSEGWQLIGGVDSATVYNQAIAR